MKRFLTGNMQFIWMVVFLSAFQCAQPKKNGTVQQGDLSIAHRVLAENLRHPWELVWGPDNFIWMTERDGRISRVDPASGNVLPLLTIDDVQSNGEGGLLGMALHPQFAAQPYVFVAYNYNNGGSYQEKIVRYTYTGSGLINPLIILDGIHASSIHNGCRLLIFRDKLFITTGDASNASSSQDVQALNGKLLRINLAGSIPADNPVSGNPVWSYGHRNAQGLALVDTTLFISEHGPDSDDEINIIVKGKNYGWPEVKGYCNTSSEQAFCAAHQVQEPIKAWTPTAAVCGLAYYNKDQIAAWKNSLLLVSLKNSRLYQLKLNSAHTEITASNEFFTQDYGRLRAICVAPDGKVYFSTSNGNNDQIIEVSAK
jgi:glucose/arabinose dehydrogenase